MVLRSLVCESLTDFFAMTMDVQIPVITENPLSACGCKKFRLDVLGDHLSICTAHSGAKKDHDWVVDQLGDLFHTTHTVKTQQVSKSRGRHCGDIELTVYLANTEGPVSLVMDLHIVHERDQRKHSFKVNLDFAYSIRVFRISRYSTTVRQKDNPLDLCRIH